MKRARLGPGAKSLERGSTFAKPRSELDRKSLKRSSSEVGRNIVGRRRKQRRQAISPASAAQRAKVRDAVSIISEQGPCDPVHIWPRSLGGCDDPLCVIPLTRSEHRAYDEGELDLLPHLVAKGCVAELQHALGHAGGALVRLLNRVTGQHWTPMQHPEGER